MKEGLTRKYTNGEVTVVWKPELCIHSTRCFRGLPAVFDPRKRPWVTMSGAPTSDIIAQVEQCPSGALSILRRAGTDVPAQQPAPAFVEVMPDGPLLVHGDILVKRTDGTEDRSSMTTAFCRCGSSGRKPYCDGSHRRVGFRG